MSYSDTELHSLLDKELDRQRTTLSLIASENIVSETLLNAMGSSVVNKTVEGFPGQRYHAGCEVADELEELTISRARELFSAGYANVQPHSGTQANQAALAATARRGDRILSMTLADGGHLSHGARFNLSGVYYEAHHYSVDPATGLIDLDALRDLAKATRPAVLIAGASSYPRDIDYASFAAIAREVGAQLLVDIAHFAGLVAVGLLNDPVPYADVVTMSTYKGLRGPRGGLIVARDAELAARLRRGVFPFSQGTQGI
uniref:serine hydroxymethyltransferase n=1 Tax=Burkholderia sp. E168m30 TaxID=1561201 RepID=UPI0019161BA9